MKKQVFYIGTSGWNYNHWKGMFYPDTLKQSEWLKFYTQTFDSVELNNSFYSLPAQKSYRTWYDISPDSFLFSVKASRYITHMKKLKDPEEPVRNFMKHVHLLKDKLGPVLFQLPPYWKCNAERLRSFIKQLPDKCRYAFEFRDPSWWTDEVEEILSENKAAFCIYELAGSLSPKTVTADFVYIRLHGPGDAYEGLYNDQILSGWAGAISAWNRQGKIVYCYFDNDQNGYAVQNAKRLKEMLEAQ